MPNKPGSAQLREIAAAAQVDPRTVRKVLNGAPVKGMARDRVERELKNRKIPFPPAVRT